MKASVCLTLLSALLLVPVFAGVGNASEGDTGYLYEQPTMEKLSRLYWGISKMDIDNNDHVDNFLRINECDIYRDYYHHEFQWKDIRKAGREFLDKHKKNFSLRFEVTQPLRLGEYDFERERFEIVDKYQVKGVRRFEILAEDYYDEVCGTNKAIDGYPRGVVLELSRPLVFDYVDIPKAKAELYISEKLEEFRKLRSDFQTKQNLFEYRDAYLTLKVKIFAYKGIHRTWEGYKRAEVLAVLEGIEVHSDREKTKPIFSQSYRQRKKMSKMERELKEQYQAKQNKKSEQSSEASTDDQPAKEEEHPAEPVAKEVEETPG